jgi:transposase
MLNLNHNSSSNNNIKIYLCTGLTDMRKGVNSLAQLAESIVSNQVFTGSMFIFRGRSADKIKIIWWDSQGFCMFYKCFDSGKFIWPKTDDNGSISITKAQLSMLIEGVDWRNPRWSKPPQYVN